MNILLPLAQAEVAGLGIGFVFLFAIIFCVLLFVAPLGIWWRLVKMHRDQTAHNTAVQKRAEQIDARLTKLTDVLSDLTVSE